MNRLLSLIVLALSLVPAVSAVNVNDGLEKSFSMAQLDDIKQAKSAILNQNLEPEDRQLQIGFLIDNLEALMEELKNRGHVKAVRAYTKCLSDLRDSLSGRQTTRNGAARRRLF